MTAMPLAFPNACFFDDRASQSTTVEGVEDEAYGRAIDGTSHLAPSIPRSPVSRANRCGFHDSSLVISDSLPVTSDCALLTVGLN